MQAQQLRQEHPKVRAVPEARGVSLARALAFALVLALALTAGALIVRSLPLQSHSGSITTTISTQAPDAAKAAQRADVERWQGLAGIDRNQPIPVEAGVGPTE